MNNLNQEAQSSEVEEIQEESKKNYFILQRLNSRWSKEENVKYAKFLEENKEEEFQI